MEKGVIPYKQYPKAPEDQEWDAPAEVREAEIEDLKIMCTWFDSENPDVKASYKLPHHQSKGYKLVWRGVAAAMGALLGARGGVDIPDTDKKGVYNHLAKHYADFDKEPPEFKTYSEDELADLEKNDFVALSNVVEEVEADFLKKDLSENIGKHIRCQFGAEVKDLGDGFMEAIISSDALDRHGEKIDMKGMDVKTYMKNPVIAAFHNYDEPSVGRTHKLTKTADGKLVAKFEWAKDIYDKAKLLYNLYKEKFQYAFSIGFMAEEVDGNVYTKSEMLEFSPVLIPANPEALLLAKKKGLDKGFEVCENKVEMEEKEVKEKEIKKAEEAKETPKEKSSEEIAELKKSIADLTNSVKEIKEADPVKTKDINGQTKDPNISVTGKEISKEEKFKLYLKGLVSKNFSEYIDAVGKDAMNTDDDSEIVPPTDFIAEVERLEELFGAARQGGVQIRRTDRISITMLLGGDDLEIFDTAQAAAKTSTKLGYDQKILTFRKFAGILPVTDELLEDSAIDIWNDATRRFARAYTEREDQLIFTEEEAEGANPGILEAAGINTVTLVGDSFEDLTYNALSEAIWGVPTDSEKNGKFFLNREILGVIQRIADENGRPIWQRAMADGTPATILGKPYIVTEVMPNLANDEPDTGFIVFGDLRYSTLGERTGLSMKVFDTGMVGDPDGETQGDDLNLLTQDIQALRAVKRMNAIVRFPTAFSVIKTASSS